MSIKAYGIALLIFVGSIMLAFMIQLQFNGNPFDQSLALTKRNPSSLDSVYHQNLKQEVLNPKKSQSHIHTEKLRGPVMIEIEDVEPGSKSAGQIFTLRFTVTSSEDLSSLDYLWSIPQGVQLISGSEQGQFQNLIANESQFVEVTFQALTGDNHQIHAHISKDHGAFQFGDVAQFNTVFEDYFKDALPTEKQKGLDAQSKPSESLFKIFE